MAARIFETYPREVREWERKLPRNEWGMVLEEPPPPKIRQMQISTRERFARNNPEIMEAWRNTFLSGELRVYSGFLFFEDAA